MKVFIFLYCELSIAIGNIVCSGKLEYNYNIYKI